MINVNASNRLNRLPFSRAHQTVLVILSFAYFFDFIDLNTFSYAAPSLLKEWNISTHTIAFITSVSYFGMFIGASAGGWFSDRFGRKKGLILVVTFFSFFSLLSSLAWNPEILGVFRFLTSLGIGATTIVASTYISEFFPSATKGKYQAICITIGICGIPAAGWVAKLVVPSASYGWRFIFLFGAVGIFFPLIARKLEESPKWLDTKGKSEQAHRILLELEAKAEKEKGELPEPAPALRSRQTAVKSVPYRTLFQKPLAGRTFVLMTMWAASTIAIQGFGTWVPTLLVKEGVSMDESIVYVTLGTIGAPLGALIASQISDRVDRKWAISVLSLIIMALGFFYGINPLPMVIVICGFLMHMFERTFSSIAYAYTPELYPVEARASGNGLTYGVGRLAIVAGPFVVSFLYSGYGFLSVFLFFTGCWFLCALTVGIFGISSKKQKMQQDDFISEETFVQQKL
ncbi:MFS transporter [Bacillus sp. KS1]|uniref:MFS transporter n=1 Tax=Bacillus sp. KS1 TaxID=2748045 RepID=UPI001CCD13AE|nr:MFS transporter [Bacillus sp. KS1]MBZ5517425.1 MFS transporter [Bacillus sp. KS1]